MSKKNESMERQRYLQEIQVVLRGITLRKNIEKFGEIERRKY